MRLKRKKGEIPPYPINGTLGAFLLLILTFSATHGQQVPYFGYNPAIENPAYQEKQGPIVGVDEAHSNFHTATGRYAPFANLVTRDGYRVVRVKKRITKATLEHLDILVIANPIHQSNHRNWKLPTPSAFTDKEIESIHQWIRSGGSLFLIADHMPFPGGAGKLAEAFGFTFSNGFAYFPKRGPNRGDTFQYGAGLKESPVTIGRSQSERVKKMVTFTGSAFRVPEDAMPILVFPKKSVSKEPDIAWKFNKRTKEVDISGWHQGALLKVGDGRIAVFGEAASFTAQLAGPQKRRMGMAAPHANQNYQMLLNTMHWLSDLDGMPD